MTVCSDHYGLHVYAGLPFGVREPPKLAIKMSSYLEEGGMSKNIKNVPTSDFEAVKSVVQKYVDGIRLGDVEICASAFFQEAIYYGVGKGRLEGGGVLEFLTFIGKNGTAPNVVANIDVLAITTTMAVVKVDLENDSIGASYNDFVTLLKIDQGWKIISKAYHQFAE